MTTIAVLSLTAGINENTMEHIIADWTGCVQHEGTRSEYDGFGAENLVEKWAVDTVVYVTDFNLFGRFILAYLYDSGQREVERYRRDGRPMQNAQRVMPGRFATSISGLSTIYFIRCVNKAGSTIEFRSIDNKIPGAETDTMTLLRDTATEIMKMHDEGFVAASCGRDSFAHLNEVQPRFRNYFPQLSIEADDYARHAYKGGWTYANPNAIGRETEFFGRTLDVNSMYSYVLTTKKLPTGAPRWFTGDIHFNDEKLYIVYAEVALRLKAGRVPSLARSKMVVGDDFITQTNGMEPMFLTSVDLEIMHRDYDVDFFEVKNGWEFDTVDGREVFGEYIDYWMDRKIKATTKLARRIAKQRQNMVIGYVAKKSAHDNRVPAWEPESRLLTFAIGDGRSTNSVYTPLGAFVTAYGRQIVTEVASKLGDDFIYSDTDSVSFTMIKEDYSDIVEIDESKLGAWKLDKEWTAIKVYGLKQYVMRLADNGTHVALAGIPRSSYSFLAYHEFAERMVFEANTGIMPQPGGAARYPQIHTVGAPLV